MHLRTLIDTHKYSSTGQNSYFRSNGLVQTQFYNTNQLKIIFKYKKMESQSHRKIWDWGMNYCNNFFTAILTKYLETEK